MGRLIIIPDECRVVRYSWLAEQLQSGRSVRSVATELGVTPQTVHYHLRQMGLKASRGWESNGRMIGGPHEIAEQYHSEPARDGTVKT